MSVIRPFSYTVIADSIGPEDESAAVDDCRASMVIQIDMSRNQGLTRADIYGGILGFPIYHPQKVASGVVTKPYMNRVLPWRHPTVRWLWATTISNVQGRKWTSKRFAPVGVSNVIYSGQIAQRTVAGGGLYSGYKYLRMTVGYTCPPYDVLSDKQVGAQPVAVGANLTANPFAEMFRFQEEEFEFSQELVTRKGTYYKWSDLRELTAVGNYRFWNGLEGQHIDVGLTIRSAKGILIRRWHQVPRFGLFGPTGRGRPWKVMGGIGKISDKPISSVNIVNPSERNPNQYDPGTLLCLPPKFIRTTAPVPNSYMYPDWNFNLLNAQHALIDIDDYPPRTYVVEQKWLFFDPPTEKNYPIRGHNLVPIPSMSIPNPLGGFFNYPTESPNYYMIQLPSQVAGAQGALNRGLYQRYPFEEMYKVW